MRAKQAQSDVRLQVLEQIIEAANRHDARSISKYFADDSVFENVTLKVTRDRKSQRQFHESLFKSFPDLHYQLTNVVANEDQVVAEFLVNGTNRNAFLGRTPTGMSIKLAVAFVIRFTGGKIKHLKSYYDSGTMLSQLGA